MFNTWSRIPGALPQFETKRALIIINLQNDSLYSRDDMYITKNHDFVDRIKALVPHFRRIGEVVWVRTEMGTKSFPSSPGSAKVEEKAAKNDEKNREERKAEEQLLEDDTQDQPAEPAEPAEAIETPQDSKSEKPAPNSDAPKDFPTYHPTSRTKAMMKRASAKSRAEQRTANMDVFNDKADVFEEHMTKPRKGQQSKFYIADTWGAEIADQLLPVVDQSKDYIMTKHFYSAFDQTPLLMSLRMKLVTDVYLCGCLTNVGVYASAADAVQHGLGVTVVEDCLGYRSEDKHEEAMRQMADIMGVNGIDSEEIIEEAGGREPPDAEVPIFSGPGPEGITLGGLSIHSSLVEQQVPEAVVNKTVPTIPNHETQAVVVTTDSTVPAPSDPTPRAQPEMPVDPLSSRLEAAASSAEQAAHKAKSLSETFTPTSSPGTASNRKRDSWLSAGAHTPGQTPSVGSGDSRILHDVLSSPLISDAFQRLKEEINWQAMYHRSGKVPRLVAVQGEITADGSIPVYRHPADESPKLLSFSPTVQKIRREVEELLGEQFNHALIQLYRDGNDNISEHSDKTLDIARDSNVINVSLGALRIMTLRTKKSRYSQGTDGSGVTRHSQRIPMPHNSVFVLGPKTNMQWLHGVRADKRPAQQRSEEERSFEGERISITFRRIATFMNLSTQTIWGQGAKEKAKANAGIITTTDDAEMEAMIRAFGRENHRTEFSWEKEYGSGFDVINLLSEKTRLTLCDDKVANLRVRLSLAEKRLQYVLVDQPPAPPQETRYKFHPWTHGLSNTQKPLFKDVDEDASETEGDLAILFYLEKFYPFSAPAGASSRERHRANALVFVRTSKSNELLFWWREMQVTQSKPQGPEGTERPVTPNATLCEEFNRDLDTWERYAAEAEYIAGDFWTIIDCAFWPVMDDIITGWESFDEKRYPKLMAYHQRVLQRECVQKVLEGKV